MTEYPRSWRINAKAGHKPIDPPTGRQWYRIRNASTATATAEISVYDEIGGWGTSAADFTRDLKAITASSIDVHISSPGGEVFDGLAIYEALRRHPANVTTYIDGLAASIASVIAMAGDRRVIARNATMMIHEASGLCLGECKDMREMAELLDKTSNNIADVYARRTGRGTVASWRKLMQAESWFLGPEAVEAGLATEQTDPDDEPDGWAQTTARLRGRDKASVDWAAAVAQLAKTPTHRTR